MDLRGDRLRRLCGDAADFGWVRGHSTENFNRPMIFQNWI